MIIDLPTKFYYEKDGSKAFVDNEILYCENNVSFERLNFVEKAPAITVDVN